MESCLRALLVVGLLLVALFALQVSSQQPQNCSSHENEDFLEFRGKVRDAVCSLRDNGTARTAFQANTKVKHGGLPFAFFAPTVVRLFNAGLTYAECRTTCSNVTEYNVTWCVQIAYLEEDIEVCIRLDESGELVTNSTCGAQVLGVQDFLSMPSKGRDCGPYSNRGCLGLKNVDYFFTQALLTCTVDTGSCYAKRFRYVFSIVNIVQPPEISEFPDAALMVWPGGRMEIHVVVATTSRITHMTWQHDDDIYTDGINEDPYCSVNSTDLIEECRVDPHPSAVVLRQQRVKFYKFIHVTENNCYGLGIHKLESYLIIDNASLADAGEYTFNATNTFSGNSNVFTVIRSVDTIIECPTSVPINSSCSNTSIVLNKGDNIQWSCQLDAIPGTSLSLLPSNVEQSISETIEKECGKEASVSYDVVETRRHECYNMYTVRVMVCAADDSVVGEFDVGMHGSAAEGTRVVVKLNPEPQGVSGSSGGVSPVAFAVPLVVVFLAMLGVGVTLLVLIRMRKRKRAQGRLTHLQSPTMKEAAFGKMRGEDGQFSPLSLRSPQQVNPEPSDPFEFPRNRLYVYSHKVLGEGSFGRVLQAKAEGIVPGMPERNMVAIKTTKDNATSVEREELLEELYLMRNMEPHENILNLLGQCTTPGGPVCLIVEFARYGNLRDFLRQCEEVVLSLNHKPQSRLRTRTFSSSSFSSMQPLITRQDSVFTPGSGHNHFVFPLPSPPGLAARNGSSSSGDGKMTAQHPGTAIPLAHSVAPIGHDYINTKGIVYMEDVHNFALQIACGLQHLASMEIVHCDLAARNVLIAEGFVLKIADFGLARDISGRELYKKNPRGKIPVKWTAPEALENRIFTTKSDVWSYGVVLWELFTYGHTPYPDVHLGPSYEALITYLKEGNRMGQPDGCSPEFYQLMQTCWKLDPDERPTPVDIVASLTPLDGVFQEGSTAINGTIQEDSKTNGFKPDDKHLASQE